MNEPGIDLTGKLIIKVALGDDIRRILITNEDITYDELVLMMQRVYRGKLSSNDDIMIKYKDEDNDLITIFDSSDLNFAIQCSRILKITLFDTAVDTELNGKPEPLQTDEIKMIKSELKHIRERCNQLLDKLDDRQPYDASSTTVDSSSSKVVPPKISESPQRASPRPSAVPQTSQGGSKEFDPLSSQRSAGDQQNKVMSSFGISNDDRPGTPDSISSIGSSSSRQQQQQGPGVPTQQGGQAPYTAGSAPGSGQKIPPWQQQQPGTPTAYHQGPQGYAGGAQQPPQQQQQQHPGYPPQSSQPGTVQPPTSQYGQGYSQAGQTGAQPAAQPGQQQPGYQQQGYGMVMPPQQQQPLPSQQPQSQGAPGPVPQQQQQQQVPQGSPYGGYQQQAPQPGAGAAQGQGPPGSGFYEESQFLPPPSKQVRLDTGHLHYYQNT
ncbi:protein TFG-like isoform X5 [Mercenaria mercenaria]|uniref:protein TFG-like isoform X5 n=1 Tax=Mercenaria mercenaria TaxID=6596 RepID=UPI00234E3FE1|nr:protein TFG-like isoform X5 [Mercenaria mercenaria]